MAAAGFWFGASSYQRQAKNKASITVRVVATRSARWRAIYRGRRRRKAASSGRQTYQKRRRKRKISLGSEGVSAAAKHQAAASRAQTLASNVSGVIGIGEEKRKFHNGENSAQKNEAAAGGGGENNMKRACGARAKLAEWSLEIIVSYARARNNA